MFMERDCSASHQHFLEAVQEASLCYERKELYEMLDRCLVRNVIRIFPATHGRCVIAKDESQHPFSESHYDRCWIKLLHTLELQKKIVPGRTELLEVTSGNAGRSLGNIARLLGYRTQIFIPPFDPSRKAGIIEAADDVVDSKYPEQNLAGAVRTFRERIGSVTSNTVHLSSEMRGKIARRKIALPNHSRVDETPEAFEQIGEELARQLPAGTHPEAFIGAIGNGSTILGILRGLQQGLGCDVSFYGFKGPLALYGAGGTDGVDFPFLEQLRERNVIRPDNTFFVQPENWEETFEEINRDQPRKQTIGRTSAMAIALARKLIEDTQGQCGDVLTVIYDKADQYGKTVVTDPNAIYRGKGQWEQH
jgi:cysteine synthase